MDHKDWPAIALVNIMDLQTFKVDPSLRKRKVFENGPGLTYHYISSLERQKDAFIDEANRPANIGILSPEWVRMRKQ